METVSVIIPIYNNGKTLKRCLDSVVSQSYHDLQIILIDDGSTDESSFLCNEYVKNDERIICFHQRNQGVSNARNVGLSHAVGKYIMFIDADDYILNDNVEMYYYAAEKDSLEIVIGGLTINEGNKTTTVMPDEGIYSQREFFSHLCKKGTEIFGYVANKIVSRNLIEDNGIRFNEKIPSQEDLDFYLSLYGKTKRVRCFPYSGYVYCRTASNRKVQYRYLLGNQVKLFNLAEGSGACTYPQIIRFQKMLYTCLYHSESVENLKNLDIDEKMMQDVHEQRKEIRFIIHAYKKGRYRFIETYFSVRRKMRKTFHMFKNKGIYDLI